MTKPVEWRRLMAESVVIVASILIAFAIDAAWDVRQDLAAEQDLLLALELDMARNRTDINRVIANHERSFEVSEKFLEMTPSELRQLTRDSAEVFRWMLYPSSFDASEAAMSTGDHGLLRDKALVRELGEWSRQLTNQRVASRLMDEAIWEIPLIGGTEAPEFFLDFGTSDALGDLRESRRFVGTQIAMQEVRSSDIYLLTDLRTQTDSVLAAIRRSKRGDGTAR